MKLFRLLLFFAAVLFLPGGLLLLLPFLARPGSAARRRVPQVR